MQDAAEYISDLKKRIAVLQAAQADEAVRKAFGGPVETRG